MNSTLSNVLGTEESASSPEPDRGALCCEPCAAWVGIDWADENHAVCIRPAEGGPDESLCVTNTAAELHQWVRTLQRRFDDRPVAVCFEKTRNLLVNVLVQYDFIVLYPVNPAMVTKYREAFAPSGAKDDDGDSATMLDLLCTHQAKLTAWVPDDDQTRKLAGLCEERRQAVDQRVGIVQELQAKLKRYYPEAITLAGKDLTSPMACAFLERWPDPVALRRAKPQTIRTFYHRHNCRSEKLIDERLDLIASTPPATKDRSIIDPLVITIRMLARTIRALSKSIEEFDAQTDKVSKAHPDTHIFRSFPGAGPRLAPRLLTAFGTDRSRYEHASDMQCYSGVAPVTEASGKRKRVRRRWRCPKFMLQTFHEFANCSLQYSAWAKAYYEHRRAQNKKVGHNTIVRALAWKWIRVIHACWKNETEYNEAQYIEALRRHKSPICEHLPAA